MDTMLLIAFYVSLVNIAVAAYVIKELYGLLWGEKKPFFARTAKLSLVVAVLFLAVEVLQLFRLFPPDMFPVIQSLFVFILLVLLLRAYGDMKERARLHEHLVKRKFRGRFRDVE